MLSLWLEVAPDDAVRDPVGGVESRPDVAPELVHAARTKVVIPTIVGTHRPTTSSLMLMRSWCCTHRPTTSSLMLMRSWCCILHYARGPGRVPMLSLRSKMCANSRHRHELVGAENTVRAALIPPTSGSAAARARSGHDDVLLLLGAASTPRAGRGARTRRQRERDRAPGSTSRDRRAPSQRCQAAVPAGGSGPPRRTSTVPAKGAMACAAHSTGDGAPLAPRCPRPAVDLSAQASGQTTA